MQVMAKVDSTTKQLSLRSLARALGVAALAASLFGMPLGAQTKQGQASSRKAKVNTPPEYPELARKMNIQGVARVLLTVAPEGNVTAVKELGGNPVLVAALVEAV